MFRHFIYKILLLCTALFLAACEQKPELIQKHYYVFGTQVSVSLIADKQLATEALQKIEQGFYQFHQDWHAWEKGGIIGKLNSAIKQEQSLQVPQSVAQFIIKSQTLAAESEHLFDPGIGHLINLWGFHSENWQGPPPSEASKQQWLQTRPSIADLTLSKTGEISSKNNQVWLDFGANAKGLALDFAVEELRKAGIEHAIVNIGGDMKAIGQKYQQPWKIGIQNPFDNDEIIASIELSSDESVVTSGNYQRFFHWQGKNYSHIINPNTAEPVEQLSAVTVIHTDATRADAAATALMIAGIKNWQRIAKQMNIHFALLIDERGQTHMTEKMRQRIQLIDN